MTDYTLESRPLFYKLASYQVMKMILIIEVTIIYKLVCICMGICMGMQPVIQNHNYWSISRCYSHRAEEVHVNEQSCMSKHLKNTLPLTGGLEVQWTGGAVSPNPNL